MMDARFLMLSMILITLVAMFGIIMLPFISIVFIIRHLKKHS